MIQDKPTTRPYLTRDPKPKATNAIMSPVLKRYFKNHKQSGFVSLIMLFGPTLFGVRNTTLLGDVSSWGAVFLHVCGVEV